MGSHLHSQRQLVARREEFESKIGAGFGQLEFYINKEVARGKNDPNVKKIKEAVDCSARAVLGPHATVMLAGSSRKGTAIHSSDVDLYVRRTQGETITRGQRSALARNVVGFSPTAGCRNVGSRVVLSFKSEAGHPDFDIALDSYNGSKRSPPNEALRDKPQACHHVVRLLKEAEHIYKLPHVPSAEIERFVVSCTRKETEFGACYRMTLSALKEGKVPPASNLSNPAWSNIARRLIRLPPDAVRANISST